MTEYMTLTSKEWKLLNKKVDACLIDYQVDNKQYYGVPESASDPIKWVIHPYFYVGELIREHLFLGRWRLVTIFYLMRAKVNRKDIKAIMKHIGVQATL